MKQQKYSEVFMTETQNGFRKGQSCTDPIICLKLLTEKKEQNLTWEHTGVCRVCESIL